VDSGTSDATVFWTAVAAIGTVGAVIVALFKDELLSRLRRPDFQLRINMGSPDCNKTDVVGPDERMTMGYAMRLWVKNSGGSTARRVQVFVDSLERALPDGGYETVSSFLPMNLTWSHSQVGSPPVVFSEGIAPDMGQHCNLAMVPWPALPNPTSAALYLYTEVQPLTLSSVLDAGDYRLKLKVAADNRKPKDFSLLLRFEGVWHDDETEMFQRGVVAGVEELRLISH